VPTAESYFSVSGKLFEKARRLLAEEIRVNPEEPFPPRPGPDENLAVALAFPNRYFTAMSNLGFHAVYRLFNARPGTRCERVFLPDPEDLGEYARTGTPLFSLETQSPVRSFDAVAFSVSYENDYLNLLKILELSGIPLRREERGERDPLVIAGGATVLMNPEPLAEFVDVFFVGEAEAAAGPLTDLLGRWRAKGGKKESLLEDLGRLEGFYIPGFYAASYGPAGLLGSFTPRTGSPARVKRVWLPCLDDFPTFSAVTTPHTELSGMLLAELSRGCRRGCRFCSGSYIYHPYRVRKGGLIAETAVLRGAPGGKIGLVGAALSDHPDLVPLAQRILESKRIPSFSSLRVDALTPDLAQVVSAAGQKTVTLAPEAGSERMRRVIRKGFGEEEILRAAEILHDGGIRSFRLYFMIGLPAEMPEDVKAIVDLTKKIRHCLVKKERGKKPLHRITLSVNSFVPKPGTPFQWHPFEEVRRLQEKIKAIRTGLKREGGVGVSADLPKWAYLQTLLARGDRRVGRLLLAAHRLGGNWPQVFREADLNPDFYVHRPRPFEERLPWDFIDHGIKKEQLWDEYRKALQEGC
jgi:radical SAM superfamily enzyme YgiQ (UPF0313 family)